MIRPAVLLIPLLAALAACGPGAPRDPAEDAARSMVAQSALFCPNEGFSWEAFDEMAARLGATPDDGPLLRPVTIREEEIVRERWVALNHLGHRTTAWIAELGPGRQYLFGTPAAVEHTSGLACAIHDPTLSRDEAFALTAGWEGGQTTGGKMSPDDPSRLVTLVRTWVNSPRGAGFYQDVEMRVRDIEASEGAMMIRRRYNYGS